jgi:hypothetical protein
MARPLASRTLLLVFLAASAVGTLTGCPKDPYDPDTWIAKLDDPGEVEAAVQELERLKDPKAIKPLGQVWKKHNKWSRALRAILTIGSTKDAKGQAQWADAVPFLEEAVRDYDPSDKRSVEDAVVACDALGKAAAPSSAAVLVEAANGPGAKALPKLSSGQNVRIAALKALGAYGANDRAVETLIAVLGVADPKVQLIQLNAAAANALAETQSPKALQPLLRALFEASPIYQQVRAAITRLGKPAIPELLKIFKGEHAAINKFAEESGFATDCDKAQGPETKCKAPGNLEFKSAALLGDLRATEAIGPLTEALGRPAKVSFFDPGSGAPGPLSHTAVLDALRQIGDPKASAAVLAYVKNPSTDDTVRPMAIDVYSMLAVDQDGIAYLANELRNTAEGSEESSKAAAMAYARLVRRADEIGSLQAIIDANAKKAAEAEARAAKASSPADKDKASGEAADYRDYATLFEQHKARAMVGVKCKADPACYIGYLDKSTDDVIKDLGIKADPKWKKATRDGFRTAALERALIEIAKLGPKAAAALPGLLANAEVTDRIIRQGVLLAMARVAKLPCDACATRLAAVVDAQKDQTTLDYLTADTRIVLNYFVATGGKIAEPAAPGTAAAAAKE